MFTKMLPVIGVGTLLAIAGITASSAAEVTTSQPSPEAEKATVVSTTVKRPPKVIHRAFKVKLTTTPTQGQVLEIINHEAQLWGISSAALTRRARCESGLRYWATNGQYVGVLQFGANAFYRGLSTIRTRRYMNTVIRYRRMHSRVYRQWSDGRTTRNKGRIVRQQVITRTVGYMTAYMRDPYTQIRIGAQALRGISAVRSSEWSCSA